MKKTTALIVDDEIELHLPKQVYAEDIFAIVDKDRAYLRVWLPWVDSSKSVQDTQAFLNNAMRYNRGGQQLNTVILYNKEVVGVISFNAIYRMNRKAEIGYWVAKDFQGKGIITRACTKLISYGFKHLSLNRIYIRVASTNEASKKIPERLGLTYDGTLREDSLLYDEFVDINVYSILKSEWQAL